MEETEKICNANEPSQNQDDGVDIRDENIPGSEGQLAVVNVVDSLAAKATDIIQIHEEPVAIAMNKWIKTVYNHREAREDQEI